MSVPVVASTSVTVPAALIVTSPNAPVAQWEFNEGQGTHTVEHVSHIDARIHGATWVKQNAGYALRFDGGSGAGGRVSYAELLLATYRRHGVELPIVEMVQDLFEGVINPQEGVARLMTRQLRSENE